MRCRNGPAAALLPGELIFYSTSGVRVAACQLRETEGPVLGGGEGGLGLGVRGALRERRAGTLRCGEEGKRGAFWYIGLHVLRRDRIHMP